MLELTAHILTPFTRYLLAYGISLTSDIAHQGPSKLDQHRVLTSSLASFAKLIEYVRTGKIQLHFRSADSGKKP